MASSEILSYVGVLAIFIVVCYIVWNERRMKTLLQGKDARSLEDTLGTLTTKIELLAQSEKKALAHLANIEGRLKKSIQKVETVRFDAFSDSGGGQSFATALLNEHGDGVVLSTLYLRDRVSMFSKPVKNCTSSYTLSPEETEAIKQAREKNS